MTPIQLAGRFRQRCGEDETVRRMTDEHAGRAEHATAERSKAERERVRKHVDRIRIDAVIREANAAIATEQPKQPRPRGRGQS